MGPHYRRRSKMLGTRVRTWMEQELARTGLKDPRKAKTVLADKAADYFGDMDAEGAAPPSYVKLAGQVVSAYTAANPTAVAPKTKGSAYPTVGMRVRWTSGGQQYSGSVIARNGDKIAVSYYLGGGKPITAALNVSDLLSPRS
jgi:hypothetical protein